MRCFFQVTPLKIKPCEPVGIVHQPFIKLTEPPIRDGAEFGYPDQILKAGKVCMCTTQLGISVTEALALHLFFLVVGGKLSC